MKESTEILISEQTIKSRIDELAKEIMNDYRGNPLTVVAILTGSLVFLADLIRRLELPLRIALVQASSYRGKTTVPGTLHVQADLLPDLRDRHILILDDILDTGRTLSHMKEEISEQGASSVRTAVLLRKKGRQVIPMEPDYCGFEIPDHFVVGYGLDYNDEYRNLPFIGILPESSGQG